MFPKNKLAQLVITAVYQFDIKTVVISPGSRNAPLTIGFSNHPNIKALSVVDERSAAFFGLGIAQQTQKPVALVCTSGSALLNYYPAIAEAFYSKIPMVVISADRPKHLIDIGDGQTIRQENVFKNHILYSANLKEDSNAKNQNLALIVKALNVSISKKGPVHINVPFDEPLYETVSEIQDVIANEVKQSVEKMTIYKGNNINVIANEVKQSVNLEPFFTIWNTAIKKLILVGSHFPDEELQTVLNEMVKDDSVLVMTETTSNLYHPKFINSIDQLIFSLDDEQLKELQPDVLITLGGMVVSKKIKQFLRKYPPKHHWHVDELTKLDTYYCLTEFVQEKASKFLVDLQVQHQPINSNYQQKWLKEKENRVKNHQEILAKSSYSDLKVFEKILESIPNNSNLQLSNSATIRYSQLFDINKTIRVFCNRGTSGIDGSTSTAVGAAFANKNSTVFITGDLSFFYDSNALWNHYIPNNFRIILINNSGGGIFRFIPGPQNTNATEYFETPHQLTAKHLAKMYNFAYQSVKDLGALEVAFDAFYEASHQPKILEIFTPKEMNDVVLKNYFKNV